MRLTFNPPVFLLVFRLLANSNPLIAFRAWYLSSFIIYLSVVTLLIKAYSHKMTILRVVWAFSLVGLWTALELGQIYMPLLLASVGAWLSLRQGRYRVAGLLIGILVAIKPNLFLWPLLLLLAGYVSVFVVACVAAALISLVPLLIFGSTAYVEWLKATVAFSGIALPGNGSLLGLTARLGLPWLGTLLSAVLVIIALVWAWRCRPSAVKLSGLALVILLLVSPVTWPGYTLFLLPVFLERGTGLNRLRVAALILVVPHMLVWLGYQVSPELFVIVGSLYCWALLFILIALARRTRRSAI